MEIEVRQFPPASQIRSRMRRFKRRASYLLIPHRQMGVWLERWVNQNFRTEGGNVGGWEPLKAGGRWIGKGSKRKFQHAEPVRLVKQAKILQDKGTLRGSFQSFATMTQVGIGSDLEYSKYHEQLDRRYRTRGGNTFLPQRRMLPRDTDRAPQREMRKIYQRWMAKEIKRL